MVQSALTFMSHLKSRSSDPNSIEQSEGVQEALGENLTLIDTVFLLYLFFHFTGGKSITCVPDNHG